MKIDKNLTLDILTQIIANVKRSLLLKRYIIVDFRINWKLYSVRLGNRTYRGVIQKCLINCMFYYIIGFISLCSFVFSKPIK